MEGLEKNQQKLSRYNLVGQSNFKDCLDFLEHKNVLALDTETTGLRPYHDDILFSIVITTSEHTFYFNFNEYPDLAQDALLVKYHLEKLASFCSQKDRLWFLMNAKFDMAMLAKEGIFLRGKIHDVQVVGRLINNNGISLKQYSLANLAKEIGLEKSKEVETYIKKNKLYTDRLVPGKKQKRKQPHFNQVPFEIMSRYAMLDGEITFKLGMYQRQTIQEMDDAKAENQPSPWVVYDNESKLIPAISEMERTGFPIDRDFCERAVAHYSAVEEKAKIDFKSFTGKDYKDSSLLFREVFHLENFVYGKPSKKTSVVSPRFDSEVLKTFQHPAAKSVTQLRDAKSNANFYLGFLYHADANGRIHTNLNQSGTTTGRFSSSDPNLQNLTKDEGEDLKAEYVVRRAFIPEPGYFLAMLDMDQAEYRLMLDYAGAFDLINKVLGGLDVHQATADLAGIKRSQAKNCNFARLYGAGIIKMAKMLQCSELEAKAIVSKIDQAAPEISQFIYLVQSRAKTRGHIFNWCGRRLLYPDPNFAYKAPNGLIQGGVGDIAKIGINQVVDYLRGRKSKFILNIHDEIVIACHAGESYILSEIRDILNNVYPHRYLPLTWGVSHSFKSLADKVEGYPS